MARRSNGGGVSGPGIPAGTAEAEGETDPTAADAPPEILAQSMREYLDGWWRRVRGGDSGVLPVVLAMVVVAVVFQIITLQHSFLRPSNLVYVFGLSTVYMVLAMAEIVVLLLGEIDLSIGAVALLGGVIAFKLVQAPSPGWPWWAAILVALACCWVMGAIQGTLTARLRIPSFVVTLAGFLLFRGILVVVLGGADGFVSVSAGVKNQTVIYDLVQELITPAAGWVLLVVVALTVGIALWLRTSSRRRSGLVAPPPGLIGIRILLVAAIGIGVVLISNVNRGTSLKTIEGIPWVIPIVLVVLGVLTLVLQRTRFGRYVYAIGGNPEAARRAGVNVASVRIRAFGLCSAIAGFGGILLGSFFYGQYSTNTADPGQLVLYSVAAAVIGGTTLFGGRGKPLHGVLGGFLIGGIAYGVSLLQLGDLSTPLQYILPGSVLIAAVLVDVVSRRGTATGRASRA